MRTGVAEAAGEAAVSADAVRSALLQDADFDRLLEKLRRGALASARPKRHAEDSLQEALLKIWRGRPELFLRGHDELLRYLRSATRRNALTLAGCDRTEAADLSELAASGTSGPEREAEARDLLEELTARLDAEEREVLQSLLCGAHSQRDLANEHGSTRYAAARSLDRIKGKLDRLIHPGSQ